MLLNVLRIPPGVSRRPAKEGSSKGGSTASLLSNFDFVNAVVDITADDVCIGNSPIFLQGLSNVKSELLVGKLEDLCGALNAVVRWAAVDVLKYGHSAFAFKASSGTPRMVPVSGELSYYMDENGEVFHFLDGNPLRGALIFLNYSKESLVPITDEKSAPVVLVSGESDGDGEVKKVYRKFIYEVLPEPVQLKNMDSVAQDLYNLERAMYRYREQLSRIVRFAVVEVGASQGDKIQEVIDDVDMAINANSMSMQSTMGGGQGFEDNIPVIPVRKSLGKPEMVTDIPSYNMGEMVDLDYTLGRFFLMARFPKSYSDFATAMDASAVSLIRGDIRYSRMVGRARTLLEDSINAWVLDSVRDEFGDSPLENSEVSLVLSSLPTSEDDDVVEALGKYSELSDSLFSFVSEAEDLDTAAAKLSLLRSLLSNVSNLPALDTVFARIEEYIDSRFLSEDAAVTSEEDVSNSMDDASEFDEE